MTGCGLFQKQISTPHPPQKKNSPPNGGLCEKYLLNLRLRSDGIAVLGVARQGRSAVFAGFGGPFIVLFGFFGGVDAGEVFGEIFVDELGTGDAAFGGFADRIIKHQSKCKCIGANLFQRVIQTFLKGIDTVEYPLQFLEIKYHAVEILDATVGRQKIGVTLRIAMAFVQKADAAIADRDHRLTLLGCQLDPESNLGLKLIEQGMEVDYRLGVHTCYNVLVHKKGTLKCCFRRAATCPRPEPAACLPLVHIQVYEALLTACVKDWRVFF